MSEVDSELPFLEGGGKMGELTRAFDWTVTSLGPPQQWPKSLQTTVGLLLQSRSPICLWWGSELLSFYNDAYQPSLGQDGDGHPPALGRPGADTWPALTAPLTRVLRGEVATWSLGQVLPTYHHDQLDNAYWSFAFSPVRDDAGRIGGVLAIGTQSTLPVTEFHPKDEPYRNLIDQAPVATCLLTGSELVIEIANAVMLSYWGRRAADVLGKPLRQALPELEGQPLLPMLADVFATGQPQTVQEMPTSILIDNELVTKHFNFTYQPLCNADGQVYAIMLMSMDVTRSRLARQVLDQHQTKQSFLLMLSDKLRPLADPGEILYQAALALGQQLGASRVGYAEYQDDNETVIVPRDYTNGVASLEGRHPFRQYGSSLISEFQAGRAVIYADALHDLSLSEEQKQVHALIEARALVNRPLLKAGQLRAVFFVHSQQPHVWSDQELDLVEEVAERTWGAVERAHTEKDLRTSEERYRTLNQELESRVQQRTRQLEESIGELRRSNENLQQFAYVASHDLQEPLRKIQQFGDLLQDQYAENLGSGVDFLERMQSAASRMSTLIRDLLNYSRLSTQSETHQYVPLSGLLDRLVEDLELRIQETGAELTLEPLPGVQGDPSQLSQLFQNLLANALKFHRSGQRPRIRVSSQLVAAGDLPPGLQLIREISACYRIDVADNGIGFDEKYAERIFQVFQRLHGKNEFAGTGIGLAICQKVATNHGGLITVSSQPGTGTTFSVYLPQ